MVWFRAAFWLIVISILVGWFSPLWLMGVVTVVVFLAIAWARRINDGTDNETSFISGYLMIFIVVFGMILWISYGVHFLLDHLSLTVNWF